MSRGRRKDPWLVRGLRVGIVQPTAGSDRKALRLLRAASWTGRVSSSWSERCRVASLVGVESSARDAAAWSGR